MLKNFDSVLNHIDGSTIVRADKPLTMRDVVVEALITPYPDEQIDGEEKYRRWGLAMKLSTGGEQNLTPEEIVLLKMLVGRAYGPLVVGPIYQYLNT